MTRIYADFFDWPDKQWKERGIAIEFTKALEREGGPRILNVKACEPGNDPPDCIAITETGERWGVEITELVSQAAVEAVQHGRDVYAQWPIAALVAHFRKTIARKDDPTKVKGGGPYDRYVLLVHTDEPGLPAELLQSVLGYEVFTTRLIDDVYVLVSYDPRIGHQPLLNFTPTKSA